MESFSLNQGKCRKTYHMLENENIFIVSKMPGASERSESEAYQLERNADEKKTELQTLFRQKTWIIREQILYFKACFPLDRRVLTDNRRAFLCGSFC